MSDKKIIKLDEVRREQTTSPPPPDDEGIGLFEKPISIALAIDDADQAYAEHERALEAERAAQFSDEQLARLFAAKHANDLRYVHLWGRWLIWDGTRWKIDEALKHRDLVRASNHEAVRGIENKKLAKAVECTKADSNVLWKACADPLFARVPSDFDADQFLLNTPKGVVDLRELKLKQNHQNYHLTKVTAVSPDGLCPINKWNEFLWRVTGGDAALKNYLQRFCGYVLTGSTQEHVLLFCHGSGANGKSTFVKTIAGILGDYHTTTPIETFTISHNDRHPAEVARLCGARLVTSTETEEGRRWAESKLKTLTGGDRIAARYMRQDFFEYDPQFKLLISGNHKPGLRSIDEAIRRRLHLVPFGITIPPRERDPELAEKLKAEWPGILWWMVQGFIEWRKLGSLVPPETVTNATAAYLDEQDAVGNWLADECERDKGHWEKTSIVFGSFKAWAERNGEYVMTQRTFTQALELKGIYAKRTSQGRGFLGLRIG